MCQSIEHKNHYTRARKKYQQDSKYTHVDDEIYLSADLQKVISLPRMGGFKLAIFNKRLTFFKETFAELGTGKSSYATIWHEAISGRMDEDIASVFYAYLHKVRDMKKVVIWLYNCGAHNKNWCFFSMLAYLINSEKVMHDMIELNTLRRDMHTCLQIQSTSKLKKS